MALQTKLTEKELEEQAHQVFDMMKTLEREGLIAPWKGTEKEKISYEDHIALFALIRAQELIREGIIRPEEKKVVAAQIAKAYFND